MKKLRPILHVYAREATQYRAGEANSSVCIDFRYQDDDDGGRLATYYSLDYKEAGGIYYNLTCRYLIDGRPRSKYGDEFNGFIITLRYDSGDDLREWKLSEMLKTLRRINKKLEVMDKQQGSTTSFSEYARRISLAIKAKEIAIAHSRYSIEEGMIQIDNLIREQRKKCLELTGNTDESFEKRVQAWCHENGYSEPSQVDNTWWAFPRGGVMQVCIESLLEI